MHSTSPDSACGPQNGGPLCPDRLSETGTVWVQSHTSTSMGSSPIQSHGLDPSGPSTYFPSPKTGEVPLSKSQQNSVCVWFQSFMFCLLFTSMIICVLFFNVFVCYFIGFSMLVSKLFICSKGIR